MTGGLWPSAAKAVSTKRKRKRITTSDLDRATWRGGQPKRQVAIRYCNRVHSGGDAAAQSSEFLVFLEFNPWTVCFDSAVWSAKDFASGALSRTLSGRRVRRT